MSSGRNSAALALCLLGVIATSSAAEFHIENTVLIADSGADPQHSTFLWPDWSADGQIVFEAEITGTQGGRFELITTDLNGGSWQLIPYDWDTDRGWGLPRFSRDGAKIMGHTTGQFDRGFLMNSDGSDIELLDPAVPGLDWGSALLSPGVTAGSALIADGASLSRVDVETQTVTWHSATTAWGADWSPDGTRMVWADGTHTLCFGDAGTGPSAGTESVYVGVNAQFPAWSATRDLILFRSGSSTFVVRPDGTGLSEIIEAASSSDMNTARWSPDGQSIVYGIDGNIYRADLVPEPGGMLVLLVMVSLRRRV